MSYYLQGFQFSCRNQVLLSHQRYEGTLLHCLDFGTAQRDYQQLVLTVWMQSKTWYAQAHPIKHLAQLLSSKQVECLERPFRPRHFLSSHLFPQATLGLKIVTGMANGTLTQTFHRTVNPNFPCCVGAPGFAFGTICFSLVSQELNCLC